jgi:hypothetical protein
MAGTLKLSNSASIKLTSGNTPLWIGPLLTGTSSLRGRQGLPMVKCIFSKQGLGKCKLVKGKEGDKWREVSCWYE